MNAPEMPIDQQFLHTLTVLYVEDEYEVRTELARFLSRRFGRVDLAENGVQGLELFGQCRYDVVITDVKMPVMDGLEMAQQMKAANEEVPVIVVTAYNETDYFLRAIDIGVDQYVKKPVDPTQLVAAVYKATRVRFQERELEEARRHALDTLTQTVAALSRAIEMRDPYTDGHQKRVAQLAVAIAEGMGLPAEQVMGIRLGALIHDVGKISIPAEILSTPRRLTTTEFAIIQTHPRAGAEIVGNIDFPWPIGSIVLEHHERMDGSGYPRGLRGEEIHLGARLVAVADVVEAISSHRPYRPALGMQAAIEEIVAGRGRLYDPMVVDLCVELLRERGVDFLS